MNQFKILENINRDSDTEQLDCNRDDRLTRRAPPWSEGEEGLGESDSHTRKV